MPGILGTRPDESSSHGLTGGFQYSAGQCDSAKRFKNGGLAQMCAEGAHEEDQERKCQREQGAAKLLGPAVSHLVVPQGCRKPMPGTCPAIKLGA